MTNNNWDQNFNESYWVENCMKSRKAFLLNNELQRSLVKKVIIAGNPGVDIKSHREIIRSKYNKISEEFGLVVHYYTESDDEQIKLRLVKIFHLYLDVALLVNIDPKDIQRVIDEEYSFLMDGSVDDMFEIISHILRVQSSSIECIYRNFYIYNSYTEQSDLLYFTHLYLEAISFYACLCLDFGIFQEDIYRYFNLVKFEDCY